ncbi:hypothetical protein BIV57_01915 [Mangrovactinospora gilvigrisea]|uniref:MaoC-like domain-containing protein n=2 Tax=Mangrovactinospora gilvigrisea TaxID=1428644 RepID=A0A1J7BKP0_9ACTN|nr:hypothetical protein BIV57_01915 [Mangrovactinospora gilvigrisea]
MHSRTAGTTPGRAPDRTPSLAASYARALAGAARRGRPSALPERTATAGRVSVDRDALAAYASLVGEPVGDALPPLYPHLLGFPLSMGLMTARDFPFPLLGLVHIENRAERRRPLDAAEGFEVRVRTENLRPHRRGTAFDVVTEVHAVRADGPVWWEASTYLHRHATDAEPRADGRPEPGEAAEPQEERAGPGELPATAVLRVPADIGRRYAAVSGDRNPIHLSRASARVFGFPRAIAHGMWTAARCLAALPGPLPPAFTTTASFRRPVRLPATAALHVQRDGERTRFALGAHLHGTVEPRPGRG